MNRRTFIKVCNALGIVLPLQPFISACSTNKTISKNDNTNPVIIIGAGAAGLVAGYLLKQQGVCFKILEASTQFGGRMKHTTEFANFPIPLGAEWIHVDPKILTEIINNDSVDIKVKTKMYDPKIDYGLFEGTKVSLDEMEMSEDSKLINSTWLDFFERYILPSVENHISYNAIVTHIDYSTDQIKVGIANGNLIASQVIVTVPVKNLQQNRITFVPDLPARKQSAIEQVEIWGGFKAFIEFSHKFYPTFVGFNQVSPSADGEKLYYDAAYGQGTTRHILGLFAVGDESFPYVEMSDDKLIQYILEELDTLFDGKASAHYIKHIFHNWNNEPYINSAYVSNNARWQTVKRLGESVDGRLFFAGEAYTDGSDWGSVHAAVYSAKDAVKDILTL
ncbi:FAD-dependent oxidoreductase [Pseudoalteromonas sp. SMS1]|uniref:flavin monoamine oxidase family protein n=1 Tax=Pseudoalteromonas sp. SMS1 TaxID=2908894 RepID=UPI001F15C634|nr:NAD(P)/FAD-dependent oxidoreductase [Pseudoalteromonas sp. SMS1]MCF2858777.1 FAD-dependent oxidoreductase [Pseudoalteromonas sp. SMS1]